MREIKRRSFCSLLAGGFAASMSGFPTHAEDVGAAPQTIVKVGRTIAARMPLDFTGLSYESTQLYDPAFFSPDNVSLIAQFRAFNPQGILRLGGNLSDCSRWQSENGDFSTPKAVAAETASEKAWEWKLTSAAAQAGRAGAITPKALEMLRGFLDRTGWTVIYGLNFGSGDIARAADEAGHAARLLGDRLLAFQIGNEVDFYGGNPRYREAGYDFDRYARELVTMWDAVRAAAPSARLGGPDTALSTDWVERFAALPGNDAVFLSSHYYAMGPASDPAMNAQRLLGPSEKLENQIAAVRRIQTQSKLPFRLTEGNSCFGGGKKGVSDAFASALWAADFLLQTAQAGYASVALHGGGDGIYTPIEAVSAPATPRPVFFGAQFANHLSGCDLLNCSVDGMTSLAAYAGQRGKRRILALINKSARSLSPKIHWPDIQERAPASVVELRAPALDTTSNIELRRADNGDTLSPYSAKILIWR